MQAVFDSPGPIAPARDPHRPLCAAGDIGWGGAANVRGSRANTAQPAPAPPGPTPQPRRGSHRWKARHLASCGTASASGAPPPRWPRLWPWSRSVLRPRAGADTAAAGAATVGATAAGGSRADPSGHAAGARRRQHRLAGHGRSAPVQGADGAGARARRRAGAQGRIAELWLIPQGEAPHSLGLVSTQVAHSVPFPADLLAKLVTGATLAISLEPPSGVPHSAPTGPIVAKGGLSL
ncbi:MULTISPECIES: anti-sigma factor domain-containing protein [Lysobacter]|uniref:anti-sigma factor domain-containing protein n=1 Tax=Lysobacter TaxID=68 RepID=UPI001F3FCFF5|nr:MULTISPECIES: anti-sigma factor [Lysobacter]UJB17465.1 anti-sigma factor [Lysobacter capsici]UJQ28812.1 anti-sigma factor [Lysobacter gummosus]